MTETSHVRSVADFFAGAREMRAAFDERFATPRRGGRDRFVWDFWHVPNQYTYVRTFASSFFPSSLYARFVERLQSWGRETLGCSRILSPWLSYYVDGCRQELHTDVPHGPWAYVFSLTDWEGREFTGGETLLLEPWCLDYWRHYDPEASTEASSLLRLIPAHFNQLTVFDPRLPHGVRPVEGTRDPLRSRVVLHGWFEAPTLASSPSVDAAGGARVARETHAALMAALRDLGAVTGLMVVRLDLGVEGGIRDMAVLSDTLVSRVGDPAGPEAVRRTVRTRLGDLRCPPLSEPGWVVVPVALPARG
jgi:hypothetical protein